MFTEFTDQVTESRQAAKAASADVSNVVAAVEETELKITAITDELRATSDRADEARNIAQQTQKHLAHNVSQVSFFFNV